MEVNNEMEISILKDRVSCLFTKFMGQARDIKNFMEVLYGFCENNCENDLSSKIMPILEVLLEKQKIFISSLDEDSLMG